MWLHFSIFADDWADEQMQKLIYNEEYHKSDGVLPGWEQGLNNPHKTASYSIGERLIKNFGISQEQNLKILDFGSGGNPGLTGLCFLDKGFDLTSYDPTVLLVRQTNNSNMKNMILFTQ